MTYKENVLRVLKEYSEEFGSKYGILSLGVFGSVAQDCSSEVSDVDVVVRLKKPSLFTLSGIRLDLEERLHKHVAIVNLRDRMNPFLKGRIERDACYV